MPPTVQLGRDVVAAVESGTSRPVPMTEAAWLGFDLHLGFVADEQGRVFTGPWTTVDLQSEQRKDAAPRRTDLKLISERANLVQSVIVRLMTARGELEQLGHPDFGSRHHELIGQPNTPTNRNLLKLHVLDCLRREPRIEPGVEISVSEGLSQDKVDIEVTARVKDDLDPLNLVVPFLFSGEDLP